MLVTVKPDNLDPCWAKNQWKNLTRLYTCNVTPKQFKEILAKRLSHEIYSPSTQALTKSNKPCANRVCWPEWWPTLECQTRRIYLCVAFLYDILHKRYSSLHFDSFYKFKFSCTRQHSLCIVPLQATINAYQYSFFVNTPFIWNSVPHCILFITKAESFYKALRTYFFS